MSERSFGFAVAGETLLSLVLAVITLGSRGLWLDETVTATLARSGLGTVFRNFLHHDATMLPFNAAVAVARTFGTGEATVRSVSVIAGAATIPVIAVLGRRLFDPVVGVMAGGILALSPFALRYAQEARSYTLTMLLVTLASYLFVRANDEPSLAGWIGYAAVAALACYSHHYAGFVILAHVSVMPFRARPARQYLVAAAVVFGVLILPLAGATASAGSGQVSWLRRPTPGMVQGAFTQVAGNRYLAVLLGVLGLGAIVLGWRAWRDPGRRSEAWPFAVVTAWWIIPFAVPVVVSLLRQPMFNARYVIVTLPALVLAASACVRRLPRGWAVAALALIVAGSALGIVDRYRQGAEEDWPAIEAFVRSRSGPDDGIVFCPEYRHIPFNYYARPHGTDDLPRLLSQPGVWTDDLNPPVRIDTEPVRDVWVVSASGDDCAFDEQIGSRTLVSTTSFGYLTVQRWRDQTGGG